MLCPSSGFARNYVPYATLIEHKSGVDSLAFSPDGRMLASGGFQEVVLWDITTARRKAALTGHTSSVENSPDGRTLASSGSTLGDSIHKPPARLTGTSPYLQQTLATWSTFLVILVDRTCGVGRSVNS